MARVIDGFVCILPFEALAGFPQGPLDINDFAWIAVTFVYEIGCLLAFRRSLGKLILSLEVVNEGSGMLAALRDSWTTPPPSLQLHQVLVRALIWPTIAAVVVRGSGLLTFIAALLTLLNFGMMLTDSWQRRGLYDRLASTTVVYVGR